jgi:ABC-2 type transport system ATP-binding protein
VHRRFGPKQALVDVSLTTNPGEVHALLGPNGAGKTTLLRILAGLMDPTQGQVLLAGRDIRLLGYRELRRLFSLVPSGDRTTYQRLSGLENLIFFGRLYGLPLRRARERAEECLGLVGLTDAARQQSGLYSQGMQKRLSIARALLVNPPIMLVDEATQSLDPEGSRTTRRLIRKLADRGTAVIWTTQRVDEIRGFADRVTVLRRGTVGFQGTVAELVSMVATQRYLVRLDRGNVAGGSLPAHLGLLEPVAGAEAGHFRLWLKEGVSVGSAIGALLADGIDVLTCREEVSDVEEAFVVVTEGVG